MNACLSAGREEHTTFSCEEFPSLRVSRTVCFLPTNALGWRRLHEGSDNRPDP